MAVQWPTGLDVKPLASAYDEQPPRLIIRTPMDSGPAKVRRKLSNNVRIVQIEMLLSQDELEDFDEFFTLTILGGALSFEWTHPRTGEAIDSRILCDDSNGPKYRWEDGSYLVSFALEVLP